MWIVILFLREIKNTVRILQWNQNDFQSVLIENINHDKDNSGFVLLNDVDNSFSNDRHVLLSDFLTHLSKCIFNGDTD